MKRGALTIVQKAEAILPPAVEEVEPPLLHLRIVGRHGVFLLQRGDTAVEEAVVDTRSPGGIACTCRQETADGECRHVAMLRACGFLADAA